MRRFLSDPDGRADLLLALAVWAVSAAAYYGAALLPPPQFDPLGSAAIPKAIAVILAILAAIILGRRCLILRTAPAPAAKPVNEKDVPAPLRLGIALASIAIIIAYVGVMDIGLLGFREATVPFVILLGGAMSRFRRSTMMVLVPLSLAIAIGFAWLFSGALYIDLPVTRWLP
jgi:putative tricarboxylic transport membrane protein